VRTAIRSARIRRTARDATAEVYFHTLLFVLVLATIVYVTVFGMR
jgi:hypothetical protein